MLNKATERVMFQMLDNDTINHLRYMKQNVGKRVYRFKELNTKNWKVNHQIHHKYTGTHSIKIKLNILKITLLRVNKDIHYLKLQQVTLSFCLNQSF